MASSYPPGVSGNEPEIAGYPECPECDTPYDPNRSDGYCDKCLCDLYDPYETYEESYYAANEDYIRENR